MASFYKVDARNKQGYKWVCVKDGPLDPVTGKRVQKERRADTQKEAEKRVDQAFSDLKDRGIDEKVMKKMTFDLVAQEWLETYSKGNVKASTIRVREKEIKILERYIAKKNINEISSRDYQKILNNLDDQDYARTTVEGVHVTAGMIFKYAMKEKLRKDSPVVGAVVPAKLRTVEEIENTALEDGYLEREELEEFFKAVREQGMKGDLETFYLLAFSGMRSGEVCALKWSDMNFVTNEVRITKTLYNPDNNMVKYELTPPKTPAAIRTVEIDQSVMDLLKALQKRQAKVKMNTRHLIEDFHDSNFVFCRGNGYPFIQKSILTRMARLLKKTTIKKKATPHIFRHTHISMLSEAGVDLITIMKRVGHDDMKTTQKIYTHVTNKMKSNAAEKVKFQFASLLSF